MVKRNDHAKMITRQLDRLVLELFLLKFIFSFAGVFFTDGNQMSWFTEWKRISHETVTKTLVMLTSNETKNENKLDVGKSSEHPLHDQLTHQELQICSG